MSDESDYTKCICVAACWQIKDCLWTTIGNILQQLIRTKKLATHKNPIKKTPKQKKSNRATAKQHQDEAMFCTNAGVLQRSNIKQESFS